MVTPKFLRLCATWTKCPTCGLLMLQASIEPRPCGTCLEIQAALAGTREEGTGQEFLDARQLIELCRSIAETWDDTEPTRKEG